jgi:hypothetical protein
LFLCDFYALNYGIDDILNVIEHYCRFYIVIKSTNCSHTDSPPLLVFQHTRCKLRKDDESIKLDQTMYRSMIGSLLYATTTKPNIMQVVGLVAIFQCAPKETHMKGVKRIFRYLKGTLDFGLWYPKA